MKTFWNILIFVPVLVFFVVINILVHEFGHCLTIEAVGGECGSIYIVPGSQIWPLAQAGQPYPYTWEDSIAVTFYDEGAPTAQAGGLASLMGSGSVAILSLLALVALYDLRPQGWLRFPLLAQSLMFLDLPFYTLLPHWFGLRHMFFVGGNTPEPLEGALAMGISETAFIAAVLIYSALMLIGCLGYVWKAARGRYGR